LADFLQDGGGLKNLHKQKVGKWGEEIAAEYLSDHGCAVKARNVRTGEGEIDLVVELEGDTRFVEVKSRTSRKFGFPEESITLKKYEHMFSAAECYLGDASSDAKSWHLDVIAIYGKPGSSDIEIEWFRDVEVE